MSGNLYTGSTNNPGGVEAKGARKKVAFFHILFHMHAVGD